MAEDDNGLTLKTPLGPIVARGSAVFITLSVIVLAGLNYFEMGKRSKEHDELKMVIKNEIEELNSEVRFLQCLNKLTLYQQTLGLKGEWMYTVPVDLYYCMPKFLTDKKAGSGR